MDQALTIQLVLHDEIDKEKWDPLYQAISQRAHLCLSFYLDHMAKQWDGLILSGGVPAENEYEAVMPLTWNKKYGMAYLYQPFLTAQLGVFGRKITEWM